MHQLLSAFVCLAMLLSGSSLPAIPDTAEVTTIRNISVSLDGETASIPHELILTTAAGMEEVGAQFEILNEDQTLLPLAASLRRDALDFSLAENDFYYSLADSFPEELDALYSASGDAAVSSLMIAMAEQYTEILRVYKEEGLDDYRAPMLYIRELAGQAGAAPENTSVTLDGIKYDAQRYRFRVTDADLKAAQIAMTRCGDPAIEAAYNALLKLEAITNAMETEGYPGAYSYDAILSEGEGFSHCRYRISSALSSGQMVFTQRGDDMSYSFNMKMRTEFGSASIAFSGDLTGSMLFPDSSETEFECFFPFADEQSAAFSGVLRQDGSAWELAVRFGRSPDEAYRELALSVSAAEETPEGRLRSIVLTIGNASFTVSFDLLKRSEAYVPFFEGKEQKLYDPTSADMVDSPMVTSLPELLRDFTAFTSDADVSALIDLLRAGINEFMYGPYPDELPELIPPEGYELVSYDSYRFMQDSIELMASFADGDKEIHVYYWGFSDMLTYYELTPEGEMLETESRLASFMPDPESNGWQIFIPGAQGEYNFYLVNIPDVEEAKQIVAGICTEG